MPKDTFEYRAFLINEIDQLYSAKTLELVLTIFQIYN